MRGYPADPDRKRNCLINYFLGIHFFVVCVFLKTGALKGRTLFSEGDA